MRRLFLFAFILCLCEIVSTASVRGQWQPTNGPFHNHVSDLLTLGSTVLAGTDTGIYRSTDNGQSWTNTFAVRDSAIEFFTSKTTVYAHLSKGIVVSYDDGQSWSTIDNSRRLLAVQNARMFAAINNSLHISDDAAITWKPVFTDEQPEQIRAIAAGGSTLLMIVSRYAGLENIYRSVDNGETWQPVAISGQYVYYVNSTFFISAPNVLYRSTDGGVTWTSTTEGIPTSTYPQHLIHYNGSLFAAMNLFNQYASKGIYRSSDNGATWSPYQQRTERIHCMHIIDSKIAIAFRYIGLYLFEEGDSEGVAVSKGFTSTSVVGKLYAADDRLYALSYNDNRLYSMRGDEWKVETKFHRQGLTLTTHGKRLIASIYPDNDSSSLIALSDDGVHWYEPDIDVPNSFIYSLITANGIIVAGGYGTDRSNNPVAGAAYSTDGGVTWKSSDIPGRVEALAVHNNIFIAGSVEGIFSSGDGEHWTEVHNFPPPYPFNGIDDIASNGSTLFACVWSAGPKPGRGIMVSHDNGVTWHYPSEGLSSGLNFYSLAVHEHYVFAGGRKRDNTAAIFVSDDNGMTWRDITDHIEGIGVQTLAVQDGYLYVGTYGAAVWRRPLSELITTSVADNTPEQLQYELLPHPVNSSSVLRLCSTCELHNATLTLSTTGGQRVRTTGNLYGTSVAIEKGGLAAGVYTFTLEEAGQVVTSGTIVIE